MPSLTSAAAMFPVATGYLIDLIGLSVGATTFAAILTTAGTAAIFVAMPLRKD